MLDKNFWHRITTMVNELELAPSSIEDYKKRDLEFLLRAATYYEDEAWKARANFLKVHTWERVQKIGFPEEEKAAWIREAVAKEMERRRVEPGPTLQLQEAQIREVAAQEVAKEVANQLPKSPAKPTRKAREKRPPLTFELCFKGEAEREKVVTAWLQAPKDEIGLSQFYTLYEVARECKLLSDRAAEKSKNPAVQIIAAHFGCYCNKNAHGQGKIDHDLSKRLERALKI